MDLDLHYNNNQNLTLCVLGNFSCFCSCLQIFFKVHFFKTLSNCLVPDQDRHVVGPDLGPTVCKGYQQTAKAIACKERLKALVHKGYQQTTSHC